MRPAGRRFLHLTDCHIVGNPGAGVPGSDTFGSMQAVLAAAADLDAPPELVIVTGDLSDDGTPRSYERIRELLVDIDLPVFVTAGNHDSLPAMREFLVGGSIFLAPRADFGTWRLVFLDSTVPGQAHGYLARAELLRLGQTLEAHPDRPAVVCLHHTPTRPCPTSACHLRNDRQLIELLDAHPPARVVLAGHAHTVIEGRARHAALLTTPATSSHCVHAQAGEGVDHEDFGASHRFDYSRHGFRMLTLHDDGRIDSEVCWLRSTA